VQGRNEFTPDEAGRIRQLLDEKERVSENQQKGIRQKLRSLGFYITDFDTSQTGFAAANFDQLVADGRVKVRQRWLFQANPTVWDLRRDLLNRSVGDVGDWSVTRFGDEMQSGDGVVLWSAGPQAGIYALGELQGEVFDRPAQGFTQSTPTAEGTEPAIRFAYTHILAEPLLRETLEDDAVVSQLSVIRGPQGTNFKVTPPQWLRIVEMITTNPDVASSDAGMTPPLHLLFKWSADVEPRTVDIHHDLADERGAVWWGKFGQRTRASLAARNLGRIRQQLDDGVDTYAFLYRPGDVWRTRLLELNRTSAAPNSTTLGNAESVLSSRSTSSTSRTSPPTSPSTPSGPSRGQPDPDRDPGRVATQRTTPHPPTGRSTRRCRTPPRLADNLVGSPGQRR